MPIAKYTVKPEAAKTTDIEELQKRIKALGVEAEKEGDEKSKKAVANMTPEMVQLVKDAKKEGPAYRGDANKRMFEAYNKAVDAFNKFTAAKAEEEKKDEKEKAKKEKEEESKKTPSKVTFVVGALPTPDDSINDEDKKVAALFVSKLKSSNNIKVAADASGADSFEWVAASKNPKDMTWTFELRIQRRPGDQPRLYAQARSADQGKTITLKFTKLGKGH